MQPCSSSYGANIRTNRMILLSDDIRDIVCAMTFPVRNGNIRSKTVLYHNFPFSHVCVVSRQICEMTIRGSLFSPLRTTTRLVAIRPTAGDRVQSPRRSAASIAMPPRRASRFSAFLAGIRGLFQAPARMINARSTFSAACCEFLNQTPLAT